MIIESRAYARAGLLGNPSDGYFGKAISIIVKNFGVTILIYQSPEIIIEENNDENKFRNIYHLSDTINQTGYYGGSRLIKATIKKFCEYCSKQQVKLENKNFTISYQTSIPRQVGLAGSSAIITASFKGLMKFYAIEIPTNILPTLILSVETEELRINAGLQDRVIQVYEGCMYMDFEKEHFLKNNYGLYTPIDPHKLPKLYIAYKTELSKVSGIVLNNIKEKYNNGDKQVHDTLAEIAECAGQGKKAIENENEIELNRLVNKNFDLRSKIMIISDSNKEMIDVARKCGASAKFPGSGGSIIGIYKDDEMLRKLIVNMRKINARVIKPYII